MAKLAQPGLAVAAVATVLAAVPAGAAAGAYHAADAAGGTITETIPSAYRVAP